MISGSRNNCLAEYCYVQILYISPLFASPMGFLASGVAGIPAKPSFLAMPAQDLATYDSPFSARLFAPCKEKDSLT